MSLNDTIVGINASELSLKLPEIPVFIVHNPYEADEFVWVTQDENKAEACFVARTTPHKAKKRIYIVEPTDELVTLFNEQNINEFKDVDVNRLKGFSQRNACVSRVGMVAIMKTK